ncbi:hypothetical protein [Cellulosimicrobium marinum]|uniref:hypothetical protein n=1 Tax=Cellulosimicrobium marinum TaxID=1638992 RepID=UPI001E5ACBF9|nr:hypothetical protein [Cellulosimicrobium marinum]MCB7136569.1 hypothetical protein [Cellulosimicrobium marinum]
MSVPPGLLADPAHDRAPSPYRTPTGPGTRPPAPQRPTTTRQRVVVGCVSGGVALLVSGVLAFTAAYLTEHGDALLVPTTGAAYDDTWDDTWDEEVWSDGPGAGTLDDPWRLDRTVYGPEWDVTLGTPRDATAEILAAHPDAAPPPDGAAYWAVPAAASYWGASAAVKDVHSVRFAFVAADGTVHDTPCPAVPGELVTTGRVPVEATRVGTLCVTAPTVPDGAWRLTLGTAGPVHLAQPSGAAS